MMNSTEMFCFQCEQTAKGRGCTKGGVCGKKADTANLQDKLIGKLIALAKASKDRSLPEISNLIMDALFVTVTNVNFDNDSINEWCDKIDLLRAKYGNTNEIDMEIIWSDEEDLRSLKSLILFGIKGIASYAYHAKNLGYFNDEVNAFFATALIYISKEHTVDELLNMVIETGNINLKCMELLDRANTETYGTPIPTKVSTNIEAGPFIIISGHDLEDLHSLLKQTEGKGINIYTHGEMLPCHGYPKLKEFSHLKGNFGTAWQSQQSEFKNVPGAILFTSNCIMPVRESYRDRVFTTSVVAYPEIIHIGEDKDFSPVIDKALALGGYEKLHKMTGINGGDTLTTGFGHSTILSRTDTLLKAVKSGAIKHIFLVGGCDGAKSGRNYYTDFVNKTPSDTIILTLACGKFRFNDLNLGEINGLPRIMDMGQCNDSYGAIKVAIELSKALKCDVNDLPLTLVLSWYEQKAVCVLLSLLALGIKNILLGPTLPAFISPNVLNIMVEKWNIAPISTSEEDLDDKLY